MSIWGLCFLHQASTLSPDDVLLQPWSWAFYVHFTLYQSQFLRVPEDFVTEKLSLSAAELLSPVTQLFGWIEAIRVYVSSIVFWSVHQNPLWGNFISPDHPIALLLLASCLCLCPTQLAELVLSCCIRGLSAPRDEAPALPTDSVSL